MNIERIDPCRVMIVLDSNDMRDFSLSYGTLSFSDPHSRKILSRLLTLACSKTGMSIENKKMIVEALPNKNGCLILLTLAEKHERKSYRVKKTEGKLCCVFRGADPLLDAARTLRGRHLPPNRAYENNDRYFLIIDGKPVPLLTLALLGEFCELIPCSRVAAARIEESGRLLADTNAIQTIAGE